MQGITHNPHNKTPYIVFFLMGKGKTHKSNLWANSRCGDTKIELNGFGT